MIIHLFYAIGALFYGILIFTAGWSACANKNGYVKKDRFRAIVADVNQIKIDIAVIKQKLEDMT